MTPAPWTVLGLLRTTTRFLEERGVDEPRLSAEHLLADTLDCRRLDLYLMHDRPLASGEVDGYRRRVRRRLAGEPVQYITGRAGFRGLDLVVDRRVLVPRPETEQLVGEVLAWARAEALRGRAAEGWRIVDVGTGSGAIACALALELERVVWVLGIDRSPDAVAVARANAVRLGADRTRWAVADLLEPLRADRPLDAIVANPPYLAAGERPSLPREVADWEPEAALFAGPRGDEVLARLVAGAPSRLKPGGLLALEVAAGQAAALQARIVGTPGLSWLATVRDLAGHERGVLALGTGG